LIETKQKTTPCNKAYTRAAVNQYTIAAPDTQLCSNTRNTTNVPKTTEQLLGSVVSKLQKNLTQLSILCCTTTG